MSFSIRCVFADLLYRLSGQPVKELVDADIDRFLKWSEFKSTHPKRITQLNHCLLGKKEFRSVFYFRMRHHRFLVGCSERLLHAPETIEFGGGGIGGGLLVSHYHAVIYPREAGKNLRVGPGVVIGRNSGAFPTIGDNVYIAANATVIGNIHIGNNVIIAAGAVVTHDVPDNSVFAGNPARLLKSIDDDPTLLSEIM